MEINTKDDGQEEEARVNYSSTGDFGDFLKDSIPNLLEAIGDKFASLEKLVIPYDGHGWRASGHDERYIEGTCVVYEDSVQAVLERLLTALNSDY